MLGDGLEASFSHSHALPRFTVSSRLRKLQHVIRFLRLVEANSGVPSTSIGRNPEQRHEGYSRMVRQNLERRSICAVTLLPFNVDPEAAIDTFVRDQHLWHRIDGVI